MVPLLIGFIVATGLALLAHRYTSLNGIVPGLREHPLHDPLDRLLPDPAQRHGPRVRYRGGGADGLHAGADLPQRRPPGCRRSRATWSTRQRAWDSRGGRSCSRSSCRWRCRRSSRACGSRHPRPSASPASRSSPARAASVPQIFADPTFRGNVVAASLLMVLLATALELIVLAHPARRHPLGAGGEPMILAALGPFGDAIEFIFHERESQAGTVRVGGLGEMWELTWTHLKLALAATVIATAFAMPLGIWLGHIGRFQFAATSTPTSGARSRRSVWSCSSSPSSASASSTSASRSCCSRSRRSSPTPTWASAGSIRRRSTPPAATG